MLAFWLGLGVAKNALDPTLLTPTHSCCFALSFLLHSDQLLMLCSRLSLGTSNSPLMLHLEPSLETVQHLLDATLHQGLDARL